MISKHLAIAAAILLMSGFGAGQAFAQANSNQPAPAASSTAAPGDAAATPGTPAPDQNAAPGAAAPAPAPAATPAPPPAPPKSAAAATSNPYGLQQLWAGGDFVIRGVIVVLALMSIGTWYIFFMKFFEQSRMLSQAGQVEKRFWASNNLNEGIDKLAKNSVFRTVAESGVRASSGQGGGVVNLNDWIGMALNRQLDEVNGKLNGGVAFLASVGSTSPFIGLFGTVWGILNALINIGIAGQASIDKVAGPVGEALISTALGLAVAVPAVLLYNFLVRRNKVINEKLRSFASDLQTYLVTKGK
ncbi:MAG TPA: MotA/TolQ/ExbB proton channel family protein [Magnetospirillaceae bacterium]|jgi:biopolymer transport protein ExbB